MSNFVKVSSDVSKALRNHFSAEDRNAEWQRVNSYVADVLKDIHVLYAKLARLQGDFGGEEFARLSKVSEATLAIGDELSKFSKAFYLGKYEMIQNEFTYGQDGAPIPNPDAGNPAPSPEHGANNPADAEAGAGGSPAESYDVAPTPEKSKEKAPKGDEEGLPQVSELLQEADDEQQEEPDYESPEEEEQK